MSKKDIPLFLLLVFIVAFGAVAMGGRPRYTHTDNTPTVPTTNVAAASAARPLYKTITMSDKEKLLLSKHSERFLKSAPIVSLRGRVEAYYSEDGRFKETEQPLKFALISGKDIFELKNIGGSLPVSLDGAEVEFSGIVSLSPTQKEFYINVSEEKLQGIVVRRSIARGSGSCGASYCALVIPLDMVGNSASLATPAEIGQYIFAGRINDALEEESYGAVDYGGMVTGWIALPDQQINLFSAPLEVEQYISANSINVDDYDQIVFLLNRPGGDNSGEGTIGSTLYSVSGTYYNIAAARVGFSPYANNADLTSSNGNLSYFDYLYTHETGHNMNALHDNLANCRTNPVALPSECLSVEYGNKYSIMGDGSLGGHFSVSQKLRTGWINSGNITLLSNATHSSSTIENAAATFAGMDGNSDGVPEYLFEKRSSTGLDTLNLFTSTNLNGLHVYRMPRNSDITTDPMTWTGGLVDTTPPSSSATWYNSVSDVVLRTHQIFTDSQTNKRFSRPLGGGVNTVQVGQASSFTQACLRKPVRVFEPDVNSGDTFTSQLSKQKWPIISTVSVAQNLVQDIHADTSIPDAQVFLYKNFTIFNDDFVACGPGQYNIELIVNGVSLPLLSESVVTLNAWSGPNFTYAMAFLPVGGMSYGQKIVQLKVTKLDGGSVFTKNMAFNLVP